MTSRTARLVSVAVAVSGSDIDLSGQIAPRAFKTDAPTFADPERRVKLAVSVPTAPAWLQRAELGG